MKYAETARRLLYAMEISNTTQQDLSNKSGVSKSSISHYVNGSNEPGNKSAYAMANVLGVNPLWLMGIDAPMAPESLIKEMTETETNIVLAFRNASSDTQAAVCAVLGVKRDTELSKEMYTKSSKEA